MAHYEPDKIIQLLQFCSWKAKTEMTHTGLHELNEELAKLTDDPLDAPNEKYLVDLFSDAKDALKRKDYLTKRKSYIDLLLQYAGFENWHNWKESVSSAVEYIKEIRTELPKKPETKIGLWHPELLKRPLSSLLSSVQSTLPFQIDLLTCPDEAPSKYIRQMTEKLNEYAFILWVIPVGWKDQPKQMTNPSWAEVMNLERIVPIWIDPDNPDQKPINIPALKKDEIISGSSGLFCCLLYLIELLYGGFGQEAKEQKGEPVKPVMTGNQFHDNSNGFFNSGSGSINQTIQHIGSQVFGASEALSKPERN